MMELCVNSLLHDSIVDGPGLRFVVFTQGCPHHCPGCHNPQTHEAGVGERLPVQEVLRRMLANPLQRGLTLSGGEPFAQARACAELARLAQGRGKDVWVYSGFTFEELFAWSDPDVYALLEACDVLVDGRFVLAERSLGLRFRGSRNQRLIDLRRSLPMGMAVPWEDGAALPQRRAVG